MRIVGVDKVPETPFERGEDAAQAGADADPAAHPPRQARARRARHGRGGDLVVHRKAGRRIVRRRPGSELALANPIASDLSDMRPSLLPGLVAAAQANTDRGFPDVALFEVGQVFKGDRPEDQLIAASGVRHGFASSQGHRAALVRLGDGRCARRQGRRVRGAGGRRRADAGAAGRAGRAGLAASRDAPAPSRSARKTCSAISANCIRARWKRLRADGPADGVRGDPRSHSRKPSRSRPAPSRCSSFRRSSRCRAISPSSSIAASRPAISCARRRASTRS